MKRSSGSIVAAMVIVAVVCSALALRAAQEDGTSAQDPAGHKPARVLLSTQTQGFQHKSIPVAKDILASIANESGKFDLTIDDELKNLTQEGLKNFDIVMFVNTTEELKIDEAQKQALLEFIKSGKGFVGVHAATDTFYQWPEYGEMIGGYFDGHPWTADTTVTLKNEAPARKITKPFGDKPFQLTEEIYQFKAPYDRSKCEVLLSLDTSKTDMSRQGIKRTDGDFAVAWIKPYGDGRVFYTSLGHNEAVWRDQRFQRHLLAGIEWASGHGKDAKVGE